MKPRKTKYLSIVCGSNSTWSPSNKKFSICLILTPRSIKHQDRQVIYIVCVSGINTWKSSLFPPPVNTSKNWSKQQKQFLKDILTWSSKQFNFEFCFFIWFLKLLDVREDWVNLFNLLSKNLHQLFVNYTLKIMQFHKC